jgi:hypothetical protein
MNEHDIILIQELTESYRLQLIWYTELRELVRKILSRLILSRGDMTELLTGLEKKQKILKNIDDERKKSFESVQKWQTIKSQIQPNAATKIFDEILQKTSIAIKEFLDEEEKLKRYLEGIIKKDTLCKEKTTS